VGHARFGYGLGPPNGTGRNGIGTGRNSKTGRAGQASSSAPEAEGAHVWSSHCPPACRSTDSRPPRLRPPTLARRTATGEERGCRAGTCRCPTPSSSSSAKVRRVLCFADRSPSHSLLLLHLSFWFRADWDNWPPEAGLLVAAYYGDIRRLKGACCLRKPLLPPGTPRHGSGFCLVAFCVREVLLCLVAFCVREVLLSDQGV
jgi:hypothetical protein